jgi:hypothetical protein
MSNNDSVPGMMLPTQNGPLAGNPRDSAIQSMNNNAHIQAQANAALSGGRHRKRKSYRGGNTIPVPQFNVPYNEVSGPGTGVNSQVQGNSQTSTQMAANSALDSGATKMGGNRKRRSRKGGNPDWLWGCMSGGKKRTSKAYGKHTKRSRKHRKTRKHRKH